MTRASLTVLALACTPLVAPACSLPKPYTLFQRVVYADATVYGTVTAVEKDELETPNHHPSLPPLSYKVAVVKVDRVITGLDGVTHIRVLFSGTTFRPDQKLCLFLNRHHELNGCYVTSGQSPWLDLANEKQKKDVEAMEALMPLASNPREALKSKSADDRVRAAILLTMNYRRTAFGKKPEEYDVTPVPLAESQFILKALGENDWDKDTDGIPNALPYQLLRLTKNNGGFLYSAALEHPDMMKKRFPGGKNDLRAAYVSWLTRDGAKYQIQRLTAKSK